MTTDRREAPATRLDVAGLLTIDFTAELRRLTEAALEGPWHVPAELVRRAVAGGATRVDVRLQASAFQVSDDGPGLEAPAIEALATLLDGSAPPDRRHQALLGLEARPGLVALAGLRPARVTIESRAGEAALALRSTGGGPRLEPAAGGPPGTSIRVETALDVDRARRFVESTARFAPARVTLDGAPVATGFRDALAEVALASPVAGRLALPRTGDVACVWLLLDGLVASSVTVPDAAAFEAAVEMRGLVQPADGPAALREAIAPHLPALADQAIALCLAAAVRLRDKPAEDQRRLRGLLVGAARRGLRRRQVMAARLLRAVVGPGREAWLSLDDLSAAVEASAGGRVVLALYPAQDPGRFLLPASPVLVLDGEERGQLSALLGVSFRPPDARPAPASGARRWPRALLAALRGLAPWPGLRPLPDHALLPRERSLRDALRAVVPEGVEFCRGARPARRARRSRRLMLPRDNPLVRACACAVARDPAWAYPAAVALLGGRSLPRPEARAGWIDGLASPDHS